MTIHGTVDGVQVAVLHIVAGGLTATTMAGLAGFVSPIISILAGLAAVITYTLQGIDWYERRKERRKKDPK